MLNRTFEELGYANAGSYSPSVYGIVKGFLYPHKQLSIRTLLDVETTVLDISFYQGSANFEQMKSNGAKGVIIRAGQNLWEDSKARIFMRDARDSEMPFGSYWYYDSRVSPGEQAEKWAVVLNGFDAKLGIWADYEESYGGNYGGWDNLYQFLEKCKEYMPGRRLGIYTGYYYWIEHSPNPLTQAASLNYFGQYPLWLAWYTTDPTIVKIPKPWSKMTFWQYTSSGDGISYGVGSREVDKNKFIGTYEEYKTLFEVEENEGDEPMTEVNWKGRILEWVTLGAIVRETPNGVDTGNRIPAGGAVEATGEPVQAGIYKWRNLVRPYQGWVADHLMEGNYVSEPVAELPNVLYIGTQPDGSDVKKYVVEA